MGEICNLSCVHLTSQDDGLGGGESLVFTTLLSLVKSGNPVIVFVKI